ARSGSRRRSARRVPAQDARIRSLACAVTAAEAEGRLDDAAAIWEMLGDPDQALRCRVARHEAAGQGAAAAALLEGRGLFEAAGQAWERAGEHAGRVRCEARRLERRRRWAEAATHWTSLGETREAERCHAQRLILAGRYAEAADAFDRADDADRALETRVIAAQIAGDRAAAIALAEGAGRPDLVAGLRRRQRPQPARAHSPARAGQLGAVGDEQSGATSGAPPRPAPARAAPPRSPGKRAGNGSGSEGAPEIQAGPRGVGGDPALDEVTEVTDAIRRRPGLLSREVASATGLSHERVQALLWKARAAGIVFKTGATRATRYWPAGSRPHIGA
ncbi:MAG TPA: hypothetical protein VMT79_13230, partial [Candidatus Binatia bacterium]|nr:hypothetical protein [Candidatus Binatia bacterium]